MAKKIPEATQETPTKKVTCPITREQFANASHLSAKVYDGKNEAVLIVPPKEFSTGLFGWHSIYKLTIMVGDVPVKVQANLLLTVVGSKELPK